MITNILDVGEAGIYSVGSKLGHASQLIYTAFAGGWQFFAFSTMKEKDQVGSNSRIFEYLGIISYVATAFICAISYSFFKIVFAEQYLVGYIIAPYLFLAPLLQMLFQVAANQFLVVKKTWPNMFILMFGAIINVILNLALIPTIGIEGASIATLVGYAVSDIICMIVLCKMKLMVVSFRFVICSLLMVCFFCIWRLLMPSNLMCGIVAAAILTVIYLIFYKSEIKSVLLKVRQKMNRKGVDE
jgi:O-antigen/teichoic acid export membrane protein